MPRLTTLARAAGERLSARASAAIWGQARRFFRMQSRLRSNEPTQIFVCAVAGALVGALVAGLHRLVDLLHQLGFDVAGDHSLSTGIGVDPWRILIVPAAGGLVLGLGALIMRRFRPNDVVDPIEANALHGGRMSMRDSLRLLVATVTLERVGRGDRHGGGLQPSSAPACSPRSASISACAAPTCASSSARAPPPPSPPPSMRRWPAPSMASS